MKPTFCGGSSGRVGTSNGRSPASSDRSAARAARFAERTDANVASASTSVAPAVAIDETATQSTCDDQRSAFSAGPSRCDACSTGSNRSPCSAMRSSATAIGKSRGRTSSVSSSQRSGVETGAPRLRPHRVDRRDRLAVAVLAVVDEHARPLLLQPLGRHLTGMLGLELPREQLRELVRVVERRRDARSGRATWIPSEPLVFTYDSSPSASSAVVHVVRDANAERERTLLLRRIEIEEHEVRPVRLVDARVPRVHVDAVHLHHPEQRLARVDEREVDEPRLALAAARPRAELARLDPRRDPLRRLLLEERAARQPFAPALHRERAVSQVRDDHVGDAAVVVEEVALRDPVVGEEHAIRARQLDLVRHQTSIVGNRASASRQDRAKSAAPMSPVNSEYRCSSACSSACTANLRARSSHSSSPVTAYAFRNA